MDRRPLPDAQSRGNAIRGRQPKLSEYRLLHVYVDGVRVGEPVAKAATLQSEIDEIFRAAISDPELHGTRIEIRVYDQHAEDCLDVQAIDAHDWSPLDLRPGHRQVCVTCGAKRER